ncbi:Peripheral subunit-binding domain-containing protein [Dioscorea alata]|uniref:Peripheral subunit-binding domain-containing protein n=1 Tax=Dioscorea alata TaxID=55571 RepID=A0ACB7VRH5_DIOAL|nr:Peripheral subunit-binding domain-containing protein [Dioscorea alata]
MAAIRQDTHESHDASSPSVSTAARSLKLRYHQIAGSSPAIASSNESEPASPEVIKSVSTATRSSKLRYHQIVGSSPAIASSNESKPASPEVIKSVSTAARSSCHL